MKVCGIIAEYNPFHNGHAYQIEAARKDGATHIICVMSGNFTQRGDAAITDKLTRTRMALACGADVVLELPVSYSLSSAADFARGGIELLSSTGCVDMLHFGSECGSVEKLLQTVSAIESLEGRRLIEPGELPVAAARGIALREHGFEEYADLLEKPNNLLGVEYLLALRRRYSHIVPYTVSRKGSGHDSEEADGVVCSASQLRRLFAEDFSAAKAYMPAAAAEIVDELRRSGQKFMALQSIDTALLSRLRMMDPGYLSHIAGVSEGLENRLYEAIRKGQSFDGICSAVKTKRYPLSRIRRILLCAAIGITKADATAKPSYIRILGQTEAGNEVLRKMSQTARLPLMIRASDADRFDTDGKRAFRLENTATDLYVMGQTPMGPCGTELTRNIYSYVKGGKL